MNIILIGPPASGKGTQAKLLEAKFNLFHISTGELLREISSQNSNLAKEIKSLIDNGHFVSDELIVEIVKNKLNELKIKNKNNSHNGVLFDGFPRTIVQAQRLEQMIDIDFIIEITLAEYSAVDRVVNRAVCSKCGKAIILSQNSNGFCESCGGEIIKRNDDTKEIAVARFKDYKKKTYPIVEYFKEHKGYHRVDGEQSIEKVFDQICKIIKEKI